MFSIPYVLNSQAGLEDCQPYGQFNLCQPTATLRGLQGEPQAELLPKLAAAGLPGGSHRGGLPHPRQPAAAGGSKAAGLLAGNQAS